jgi:tyrosyl-tRNA synthetase
MVRRRTAALLAAVVVLACFGAQLASAAAEEDTLQFTEEFLKTKINKAMLNLPRAVMAARNGTLKKAAATAPKQVRQQAVRS